MSSVQAMPTEIILQILGELHSDDLLNFCSSWSQVYKCAGPSLRRYRDLRERYQSISLDDYVDSLLDFADSPNKALYVKRVSIRSLHVPTHFWARTQARTGIAQTYIEAIKSKMQLGAALSAYSEWPQLSLVQNPSDPFDGLLMICLYLFPNMETIAVDARFCARPLNDTGKFINSIAKQNKSSGSRALRNLSEVNITRSAAAYPSSLDLSVFSTFLSLPGVKKIRGKGIQTHEVWTQSHSERLSTATDLRLEDCVVAPEHFENLFRCLKALKCFEYSQDHQGHVCSQAFEEGATRKMDEHLLKYAGETLERLVLHVDCREISPAFRTLRSFSVLKFVSMDVSILQDDQCNYISLVEVLPESITDVGLTIWAGGNQFPDIRRSLALLAGLPTRHKSRTPLLQHIHYRLEEPESIIDCARDSQVPARTKSELRKIYLAAADAFGGARGDKSPIKYTLAEYITLLLYRQSCPRRFAPTRTGLMRTGLSLDY